jgi:putative transferase (TIGR04331 family)
MPIAITDINQLARLTNLHASPDEILADPWDDREKRLRAFHTTQNIYKKNIANLSKVLNKHHKVNFSVRYWSIICGPWFRLFTNRLYHFWEYFESIEIGSTVSIDVPDFDLGDFIANNQENFYEISRSSQWNQLIIGKLAGHRGIKVQCVNREIPIFSKAKEKKSPSAGSKILKFLNSQIDPLVKKSVLMTSTNFSGFQKFKLMLRLRERLYILNDEFELPTFDYDRGKRYSIVASAKDLVKSETDFEHVLIELALLHMPKPFIEGYVECNRLSIQSRLPEKPGVILTGTAIYGNELFKIYSAAKIEKGCKLCVIRHGGGAHLYTDFLEHELDICDRYFTWGWHHESPKCVKGFNIRLPKRDKITGKERSLLIIMTASQDNTEFLESMPSKRQFRVDYVGDQVSFVRKLRDDIVPNIKIRLAEHRQSFVRDGMYDLYPDLHYIYRGEDLSAFKKDARILVVTYNETSIVEALASNKPTIVFFRPKHFEMNSEGVDVYHELSQVGVFHDTPESAAQHINKIWDHVSEWWNSEAVREAVGHHNSQFSRISKHPTKEILSFVTF